MQIISSLLVSTRDASIDYAVNNPIIQKKQPVQGGLITCPHCGIPSLAAGKIKNGWYSLCPCGTYIQTCTNDADYSD